MWQAYPYALGAAESTAILNVSANSESSSVFRVLPSHLAQAPDSRQIAQQPINLQTRDAIFDSVAGQAKNIYLKIDTQGYEESPRGRDPFSCAVATLQLEMSLLPLYHDAPLMPEILERVGRLGYELVSLEPGLTASTARLYQVDGIFHRFAPSG